MGNGDATLATSAYELIHLAFGQVPHTRGAHREWAQSQELSQLPADYCGFSVLALRQVSGLRIPELKRRCSRRSPHLHLCIYIYINSKRYPGCLAKTTRITLQNPVKRLGVSGGTAPFFKLKLRRAWVLQKWFVVDPEWPEFHILFFFVFARDLTLSSFSTFCHLVPLLIAKPCGLCSSLRLDASEKPKDYYIG